MTDLGTLGGSYSEACGINNLGQVIGDSATAESNQHAFIWQAGSMIDLNTLIPANSGWVLKQATAINNLGQIVGMGTFNDELHAYIMTPKP